MDETLTVCWDVKQKDIGKLVENKESEGLASIHRITVKYKKGFLILIDTQLDDLLLNPRMQDPAHPLA